MNLLEERYRRVLRLLPAGYRAAREEEMVAAFLDAAGDVDDADDHRPGWPEIASVVALAVRVRLGGPGGSPRAAVRGETVRRAAHLGLLIQALLGCVTVGAALRLYGQAGAAAPGLDYAALIGPAGSARRLASLTSGVSGLLWIAAFATLLTGRRRGGRVLALLAALPVIAGPAVRVVALLSGPPARADEAGQALPTVTAYAVLAAVPVLALLAGYHREAPAPHRPSGRAVALLATVALAATASGTLTARPGLSPAVLPWVDPGGVFCLALLVTGLAYACVHVAAPARRNPAWPLALVILLVPDLVTRLVVIHAYSPASGLTSLLLQTVTAALTGALLLALGARALRGVPDAPQPLA
jgi:hypothetical protein